jgi:peptide/nickel transport system ATP-binding protein/oligopeptide transport system ATP-binding protein
LNDTILEINDLKTQFFTLEGIVKAVDGVSIKLEKGETLGLAGESGCGKSTLAYSIIRYVPHPGKIVDGDIFFQDENIMQKSDEEIRLIRGKEIGFIFQNPLSALNPVFTINDQIREVYQIHTDIDKEDIDDNIAELLEKVGIPDPVKMMQQFPHQFSGGMRQRALIAMAIACNPPLLIADEPTTSLDVTIQAQIMELLKDLRNKMNSSIVLITHDLGLIGEMCDKVAIMYAGKIVEYSDVRTVIKNPKHPYVISLLNSFPGLTREIDVFNVIKGSVPSLINPPSGCRFWPRCDNASEVCMKDDPEFIEIEKGHFVSCHKCDEL